MSASPHSFSTFGTPPASPQPQRNSRGSLNQLPLPTTMTTSSPSRRLQVHAPGISPAASFFRPAKPRPPSMVSSEHPLSIIKQMSRNSLDDEQATYPTRKTPSRISSRSPSPTPSFDFHHEKDMSHVTRTPLTKRYTIHPSNNRFFLDGRILVGGDKPWAFIGALTVVIGLAGLYCGTTAVWWWHHRGAGGKALVVITGYLACITISSMLVTAFTDPGILPRDLDPDPPFHEIEGGEPAPMPRILKVRSDVVRVKYCQTCLTYRPPRSTHCKLCDNCVDDCDHHCQWVNNCIGRRNYTSFFTLLFAAIISLILIIVQSALVFALSDGSFHTTLKSTDGASSGVVFILAVAVIWPVGALFGYHCRLLLLNITTVEQIRNQAHKSITSESAGPNPFSHGSWRRNVVAILCRPRGYSWLDPTGPVTDDLRAVNPGVVEEDIV
ncbi:zf-DHHC-domain-containing protein [Cylindrobasidium torrendii FP15055 ss-10]|uniref:Palmitoyltransferase n=1 Tax=Cylindrobasidium torrendii FP15055 ss-10 TaxID=1314674 RepID=A0A0D7B521_9AGAR|nr:zf-DHHC-domain-containing protein [Cylindrobasidium torrendii FP15055 ss-10]